MQIKGKASRTLPRLLAQRWQPMLASELLGFFLHDRFDLLVWMCVWWGYDTGSRGESTNQAMRGRDLSLQAN